MNRQEAEAFVYRSYLKAERYHAYRTRDSMKRMPQLTKDILANASGTPATVITGSKGKGSVANMISQILRTGYKVGLMTSPHVASFCERFKIDGIDISDEDFTKYMSLIQPEISKIDAHIPAHAYISPMGIQAALALTYFKANRTDFNIFECGKGARYDDVNNIRHDYAVINPIFPEHIRELGDTVEEIAIDKAHVITGEQKCVYVASQNPSVLEIIKARAATFSTPVKIYGQDFEAHHIRYTHSGMLFDVRIGDMRWHDISIPLLGKHQAENCALAMALSLDILGSFDMENIRRMLASLEWQGRMEVLSAKPFILLDACIHAASCVHVKAVMQHLNIRKATIVIGIPDDKDYAGVAREMQPVASRILLTKSQNPHYIFTDEQCKSLAKEGIATIWTDSVEAALRISKDRGEPIIILGTTSVVSEVKGRI